MFWLQENRSVQLLLHVALRLQSRLILGAFDKPHCRQSETFSFETVAVALLFGLSLVSIG